MPVPLDGLILALILWIGSSAFAWRKLSRRAKSVGELAETFILAAVVLGVLSFAFFYFYERMHGRVG
jgi:hypothetical protein